MANQNPTADTTTVHQSFDQGDMGTWIERNKNLAIGILILILVGIAGYGILMNQAGKSKDKNDNSIYDFTSQSLVAFDKKEIDSNALVEKYNALSKDVGSYSGLFPAAINVSDALFNSGNRKQAIEVLKSSQASFKDSYQIYLISSRLATMLEDEGQVDEAITVLEGLSGTNLKVLEEKTYLDLGRLYLDKGNSEKAKASFQYVVDNGKENEFIKLAKLYLAEL
jgi:predicted negative regulator of RcsB-dependent stress response